MALINIDDPNVYQARERGNGRREFYMFHNPTDTSYPAMLELFARKPEALEIPEDAGLTVVEVSDETLSLSAILLDTDYYEALLESRRVIDDILVLDERLLIPFKARAFVGLSQRKDDGEPMPSGSFPTTTPLSGSLERSCSRPTTNGRSRADT